MTLFMTCFSSCRPTLYCFTVQRHGREKEHIQDADNEGNCALHLAVQNGSWDVSRSLSQQMQQFPHQTITGELQCSRKGILVANMPL